MGIIERINQTLFRHAPSSTNIGLLNGKMGVALYAFRAGRAYGDTALNDLAGKMIDDVVDQLETAEMLCGFDDGLAGIMYGFEYLIRNRFISPDGEGVFQDMDDRIFRTVINTENMSIGFSGITGYLLYLYPKLVWGGSISVRYGRRLVIELVNRLSREIGHTENHFYEPLAFNFLWNLPLIMLSLSKIYALHVYDRKIHHAVEQLAPGILSLFPKLHANRLYLLYGMKALNHLDIPGWTEHISLLEQNISMNRIVNEELKDRAIVVKNGIAGISLICDRLTLLDSQNPFQVASGELESKIAKSEYWSPQTEDNIGILFGQTGMGLALLKEHME